MAPAVTGAPNGSSIPLRSISYPGWDRFSDIPAAIDIPVSGDDFEEAVEVNLEELLDDPTELFTLLENENVTKSFWAVIALAYAKQLKIDHAIETSIQGLSALDKIPNDKLNLLCCLAWLYLRKCREAPRIVSGHDSPAVKSKDSYLQSATSTLNEASRINSSYPPLFLARGVLCLLRISLLPPPKTMASAPENAERSDALEQAAKSFEDSLKASGGNNIMALLGKARVYFHRGKYPEALKSYQAVLEKAPGLKDPDPRIGIGCCLWQLDHKPEARLAWQRSLTLNPYSKAAYALLGLYYTHESSQFAPDSPEFLTIYREALTEYTQKAFKLDGNSPFACASFANYFFARKAMSQVEKLTRRAIEYSDVNAITGDAWYLLARKEHISDDILSAKDCYHYADQARGGDDHGYVPAKFGLIQTKLALGDIQGAKINLEKLLLKLKSTEATTLLAMICTEEYFKGQESQPKHDKPADLKRAISLFESLRTAWKDAKRQVPADSSVLLTLARLYEVSQPEKALQCLQAAEMLELDRLAKALPKGEINLTDDEPQEKKKLRELLSPQLLNNIGCFHYKAEKYGESLEMFQAALNACINPENKSAGADSEAMVTTISFNLGRSYEAEGKALEAKGIYEGLLERQGDYIDASTRLAYINLRQNPTDEGPKAIQKLLQSDPANLEVRALFGWYLSKAKRRTQNVAEDQEQRHYKHTLQQHDKHDLYSLTGMGNIYLTIAREMRRDTDQDKEKRHKMYEKAVEFFDKTLQLDPLNMFAAQGIAIALVEDKRDFITAVQIFSKVRECSRDSNVFLNLGHVYCELKQYSRSIENYELALSKDRARDTQILSCLGRVWLLKGKQDSSFPAMKTALEYSKRALEVTPDQIHFQFNVAFVQFQIVVLINSLSESRKTLEDVEFAAEGLNEAAEAFMSIAKAPNPPFPRNDIEQRAAMCQNTMIRQMERARQSQIEYEGKNAAKLQEAREIRRVEMEKREAEKKRVEEEAQEQRRKIAEERQRMQERDRELAEQRAEQDRLKEEADFTVDEETGEKKKRTKRKVSKRKKKSDEVHSDEEESTEAPPPTRRGRRRSPAASTSPPPMTDEEKLRQPKKRKLERGTKSSAKATKSATKLASKQASKQASKPTRSGGKVFKSTELVIDSDEEDDDDGGNDEEATNGIDSAAEPAAAAVASSSAPSPASERSDSEAPTTAAPRLRKRATRVIEDDEDDDEDDGGGDGEAGEAVGANSSDDYDVDDLSDTKENRKSARAAGNWRARALASASASASATASAIASPGQYSDAREDVPMLDADD